MVLFIFKTRTNDPCLLRFFILKYTGMKTKSAIATLSAILTVSAAFAYTAHATTDDSSSRTVPAAVAADTPKVKEMKNILFKLVRQDEHLDETIETLNTSKRKLSVYDLSALGLSLKVIKSNLDTVSTMNKDQFPEVQPNRNLTIYTRAILSYSRSISRKITKISSLVTGTPLKNKRPAMRDAVASRKGKKTGNEKRLTRIIEEQKAMEMLSSDIELLKASSRKLNATSKWLYIVSK